LSVTPIVTERRGSRFAHLEITISRARGLRGIVVTAGEGRPPIRLGPAELRRHGLQDGRVRLFVHVPLAPGKNSVRVKVEMLTGLSVPKDKVLELTREVSETRLHV